LRKRVSTAFEKLVASAAELNAVSDELAEPVSAIEAALQELNLGVSAWTQFAGKFDYDTGYFWDHSIGYAKVARTWSIAIRTRTGSAGEHEENEIWRFNDAPRSYRIQALEKLPDLLDQLVKTSGETAAKLKAQVASAKQVAETMTQMAPSARRK
jgi:methyl-accepting chemotaxis protein